MITAPSSSSVTPSRVCELKFCSSYSYIQQDFVTPSRVCELKFLSFAGNRWLSVPSHPHGCVSWNIDESYVPAPIESHPHGCVSWNPMELPWIFQQEVTPSRVCELKSLLSFNNPSLRMSHPHGCVSWNRQHRFAYSDFRSHPHGCVSWNTKADVVSAIKEVTPSRVCELKSGRSRWRRWVGRVTPSRVCELKLSRPKLHTFP